MFSNRKGRDVYVLGAANVGKSSFIRAALKSMRKDGNFQAPGKRSGLADDARHVIPTTVFNSAFHLSSFASGTLAANATYDVTSSVYQALTSGCQQRPPCRAPRSASSRSTRLRTRGCCTTPPACSCTTGSTRSWAGRDSWIELATS
jgi:hypothetical protein